MHKNWLFFVQYSWGLCNFRVVQNCMILWLTMSSCLNLDFRALDEYGSSLTNRLKMSSNSCHFASKSNLKCMHLSPHQSLDTLDRASMKIPGKHMKISWLILSRVGIHYLSSTFGSWTICQIHRKEFLDTWQVPGKISLDCKTQHSVCFKVRIPLFSQMYSSGS